jgi:hypothetical protein
MRNKLLTLLACAFTGFVLFQAASCLKPPDYDEAPTIEFVSWSKNTVFEDSTFVVNGTEVTASDSLLLVFKFTDGDGDLGPLDQNDPATNIYLTDNRDQSVKEYQMPRLTPDGSIKAISGEITVAITSFACQPNNGEDQFHYTVQIKDRAGNLSNTFDTPPITIDCQQ